MATSVPNFKMRFFEFAYGFIVFCSRYVVSFAAYLSISTLISGLHKMPQTLDLPFFLYLDIREGSPYSLRGVIIF